MDPPKQPNNANGTAVDSSEASCKLLADVAGNLQRSVCWLIRAVMLTATALLVLAAVEFGSLINYYGFDTTLLGGAFILAPVIGFVFGWWARSLLGR